MPPRPRLLFCRTIRVVVGAYERREPENNGERSIVREHIETFPRGIRREERGNPPVLRRRRGAWRYLRW
jgi:hypothetical protein